MAGRRLILAAGAAAGLAALAGCERGGPGSAPVAFQGIDITGAQYANDFALPDADGTMRRLADFRGQVVVVFFGFTQCPDVCPAALQEIAAVKQSLGADGAKVRGVFITVDPERDTPALLKAYVGNFGPDFVALRGSLEETTALAKAYKVYFNKVPGKSDPAAYTMDHTAGSFVYDPQGRIRLFTRYGTGAQALLADVRLLRAGA